MADQDEWPKNEILFGPLANALCGMGRLDGGPLSPKDVIGIAVSLTNAADSLSDWGFTATAQAFSDLAEMIQAHVTRGATHLYGPEQVPAFVTMARQALMSELQAHVFFPVESGDAHHYRDPLRDWESVLERFPQTARDIEEAAICYALRRYAACVFHCMQVVEHGLADLGAFMGVADPKSGFTAVTNELSRVLGKKYDARTDFEREHYAFFEQVSGVVAPLKNAWRNKIDHAQGALRLLTTDFSQQILA